VFERAFKKYSRNLTILERVAQLYLERGKVAEVLAAADRMIRLDPKLSTGYILRAMANTRLGNTTAALDDLQQVVFSDPKNIVAHNELGRLYLRLGDRVRARREFEQVLILNPNDEFAKQMLSRIK